MFFILLTFLYVILNVNSLSLGAKLVEKVMNSPLYFPIVAQARKTMVKTAQEAGLEWEELKKNMIESESNWDTLIQNVINEKEINYPDYYLNKFHGYSQGNLELDAAVEQELAGKAVGARNFPNEGLKGEEKLRSCYENCLNQFGIQSYVDNNETVVDMGCGTGTSTRRLAKMFPQASKIIGYDLSPYMLVVGNKLLNGKDTPFEWVEEVDTNDDRIELQYADITSTPLLDNSVAFVSLCLVMHELPKDATEAVFKEAFRILQPGGVLGIMEMDPSAPGYIKLRENTMLFSILRSTEPFLDVYFDQVAPELPSMLSSCGFTFSNCFAATGRHMVITAIKSGFRDLRPSNEEREKADEHLKTTSTAVASSSSFKSNM